MLRKRAGDLELAIRLRLCAREQEKAGNGRGIRHVDCGGERRCPVPPDCTSDKRIRLMEAELWLSPKEICRSFRVRANAGYQARNGPAR